jgi:hypothetical protein
MSLLHASQYLWPHLRRDNRRAHQFIDFPNAMKYHTMTTSAAIPPIATPTIIQHHQGIPTPYSRMMDMSRVIPQLFHTGPNHSTRGMFSMSHTNSQMMIMSCGIPSGPSTPSHVRRPDSPHSRPAARVGGMGTPSTACSSSRGVEQGSARTRARVVSVAPCGTHACLRCSVPGSAVSTHGSS